MRERRALRQFTLSTGKSAGRNSSGRITVFHRGGGSKRLQRRIDLKRSTSSMGIVERIEYDPHRSSRIAPVRWVQLRRQRKCNTIKEFAPLFIVIACIGLTALIMGWWVPSWNSLATQVILGRTLCAFGGKLGLPLVFVFLILFSGDAESWKSMLPSGAEAGASTSGANAGPSNSSSWTHALFGSGASSSGNGDWRSFDERVLLEPMPDSSSPSVNGGEPMDSSQTSVDPDNAHELNLKKAELHGLIQSQFRHYIERGRPRWQLSSDPTLYSETTSSIINGLEIGPTVSEHNEWITHLQQNPRTLYDIFKSFK